MEFLFHIQDPADPNTQYLYEAIIGSVTEATTWRGLYAFATRGGVDQLIEDPVVHDFMHRGGAIEFIVGIDAVTNRQTLERMQELETLHPMFHPQVFWNKTRGLFHPKISHFGYADGRKKLIVGSGNLTPGGLMHNFECYSVVTGRRRETLDLSSLDEFVARHAADIRPIDEEALERAALNLLRPVVAFPRPRLPQPRPPGVHPQPVARAAQVVALDRVLVAEVPDAGGRWSQSHLNAAVIEDYFRVSNLATQRVYLTHVDAGGVRDNVKVRQIVYSASNKNYKVEISAAKGKDYPIAGHPMLIFRERQVRCFDYMLLLPGDPGYLETVALSQALPRLGKGFRRSVTDLHTLAQAWPDCPLVTTVAAINDDI
jgi:hypothetical protein